MDSDLVARIQELRTLGNAAWKEFAAGRYVAAEKIVEDHLSDDEPGVRLLRGYATALMYQGRFLEAHRAFSRFRAYEESMTNVIGTINTSISACSWCLRRESDAIGELRPYAEMLTRARKVPRGKALYASDRAGFLDCAVIYYFGVRLADQTTIEFAETSLRTLLEKYRKSSLSFASALAGYLIGELPLDAAAGKVEGVDTFEQLAEMPDRGIFADRTYLTLKFYKAVRELLLSRDSTAFQREMEGVVALRHYHIDDEWIFARSEVEWHSTLANSETAVR